MAQQLLHNTESLRVQQSLQKQVLQRNKVQVQEPIHSKALVQALLRSMVLALEFHNRLACHSLLFEQLYVQHASLASETRIRHHRSLELNNQLHHHKLVALELVLEHCNLLHRRKLLFEHANERAIRHRIHVQQTLRFPFQLPPHR